MLSSLSSFLPNALQSHPHPATTTDTTTTTTTQTRPEDPETDDEAKSDFGGPDELGVKKKQKSKGVTEKFIFVRPPPSKSNHPLNLQVQMVPPRAPSTNSGQASVRQSLDFAPSEVAAATSASASTNASPTSTTDEQDLSLRRVASNRSEASTYAGSTASISSFSSNSTGGRRTIIPLYNLQAHNVMTNIIVDAGTDAKIARFQKRGLEMIGLAFLEPIEVWRGGVSVAQAEAANELLMHPPRASLDGKEGSPEGPHTPASASAISINSSSNLSAHEDPTPAAPATPVPRERKRDMIGKLFKKKEASPSHSSSTLAPPQPSLGGRFSRHLARPSFGDRAPTLPQDPNGLVTTSTTHSATSSNSQSPAQAQAQAEMLRPPILGIQPTLSCAVYPPTGRPAMYVWVTKRWLKNHDTGVLGGMMKNLRTGPGGSHAPPVAPRGAVEVRYEWKRGSKSDGKKKGRNPQRQASGSHFSEMEGGTQRDKRKNRVSIASLRSAASTASGHSPPRGGGGGEDDGEESDSEDSETPWTCTLRIKRLPSPASPTTPTPHSPYPVTALAPVSESIKIKVGTITPTPHHPKVVAMLKVPFPLSDFEIERMVVRKRILGPTGVVERTLNEAVAARELVLTAEEIKDVVSCTGMWLAVRESFAGIGKVSRKGDGWRLRA